MYFQGFENHLLADPFYGTLRNAQLYQFLGKRVDLGEARLPQGLLGIGVGREGTSDPDREVVLLHRPSFLIWKLVEEGYRWCISDPFSLVLACFPVVLRVHGARELQEGNDAFAGIGQQHNRLV